MPNAKDTAINASDNILLLGPTGSGKTAQTLTLPGKTFVYAFDPNCLNTLRGHDIDYEIFCPDITDIDLSVKTLKKNIGDRAKREIEPFTYINWEEDFEKKLESNFFDDYDNLSFDSFTTFADTVMDRVQFLNGKLGKQPEQDDWAAQIFTIGNIFRVLSNLDATFVTTAHTEIRQDDTSKRVYGHIMMPGRLRVRLPLLFSNIWACRCDSDKNEEKFIIQTRPDRENPTIRSSIRGLDMFHDVTIKDWDRPKNYGIGKLLSDDKKNPEKPPKGKVVPLKKDK